MCLSLASQNFSSRVHFSFLFLPFFLFHSFCLAALPLSACFSRVRCLACSPRREVEERAPERLPVRFGRFVELGAFGKLRAAHEERLHERRPPLVRQSTVQRWPLRPQRKKHRVERSKKDKTRKEKKWKERSSRRAAKLHHRLTLMCDATTPSKHPLHAE